MTDKEYYEWVESRINDWKVERRKAIWWSVAFPVVCSVLLAIDGCYILATIYLILPLLANLTLFPAIRTGIARLNKSKERLRRMQLDPENTEFYLRK